VMRNMIVKLTSDKHSCMGFDDAYLYISSRLDHQTIDELKHAARESKSGRKGYEVIELKSIREITVHQKRTDFLLRYEKHSKMKKYVLEIEDNELRTTFCESLAEASRLKTKTETNNPYSRVGVNAIQIIMTVLFTGACYAGASGIIPEAEESTAKSRLWSDSLKAIGPTAFLIIGLSLIGFFLFRLMRNIKDSDTKMVYTF
jgi:hypothetical protein